LPRQIENKNTRLENIADVIFAEDPGDILENLEFVEFASEKWHIMGSYRVLPNRVGNKIVY
jgi:hypothetical protein